MASIRATLNSKQAAIDWCREILKFWLEHKYIQVTANDKRSLDQNATIRLCYKQMQQNWEGMTLKDIERHCKLNYAAPLLADNSIVFGDLFKRLKPIYNYEQMLKVMDTLQVTSHDEFSTGLAKEFIAQLMNDFSYISIEKN